MIRLTKRIPDKCKNCSMEDKYKPLHPGACGICIANKEGDNERD